MNFKNLRIYLILLAFPIYKDLRILNIYLGSFSLL
jgi:predicted membrane channel-forming protein YqfA (hemolysin III family)